MSQCHTFELCDISRFCHTVCIPLVFLAKSKISKKAQKCHKSAAATGLFSDVLQISTFRSYVSLSFGSDKSRILILATFTFKVWNLAWNDSYCRLRALCIVQWLHVLPPHLNTLVWPLPNWTIQVWFQQLFSREKSIQSSRWPKLYLTQITLNLWVVWGPAHFLPLHQTRVPPGDIQLLFSFSLHIFFYPSHSLACHVLCSKLAPTVCIWEQGLRHSIHV